MDRVKPEGLIAGSIGSQEEDLVQFIVAPTFDDINKYTRTEAQAYNMLQAIMPLWHGWLCHLLPNIGNACYLIFARSIRADGAPRIRQ